MTSGTPGVPFQGQVMAVGGPISPGSLDVIDAHNHLWIEAVGGASPDSPRLTEYDAILSELKEYAEAGGAAIVDCQPGGCGRNGTKLLQLSRESGVSVVAATGFHRRTYYPESWWMWEASSQAIARYFIDEVRAGLQETLELPEPIKAGFIKCACESTVGDTPEAPLEAAASAAAELGLCVEVHTEKGSDAEGILHFFVSRGVRAGQIVLCHMDKLPDFGLHRSLAQAGACLEYDTFYRPKYAPEKNVWSLIETMVQNGLDHSIALATDMAEASMWRHLGDGPGLTGLVKEIRPRLEDMRLGTPAIQNLIGGNIGRRLSGTA